MGAWLDSDARRSLLARSTSLLEDEGTTNVIEGTSTDASPQHMVTEIITVSVNPGKEEAYREWVDHIRQMEARFPGYKGLQLQPPIPDGVVVAAAAGNSNSNLPHYPAAGNGAAASADGLVAVTAVDRYGKKSGYANYGTWVDIAAPGNGIRSTFPVGMYANWSGTSMATPFVSGQAALIHAVYGSRGPADVEAKMRRSAQSLTLQNLT